MSATKFVGLSLLATAPVVGAMPEEAGNIAMWAMVICGSLLLVSSMNLMGTGDIAKTYTRGYGTGSMSKVIGIVCVVILAVFIFGGLAYGEDKAGEGMVRKGLSKIWQAPKQTYTYGSKQKTKAANWISDKKTRASNWFRNPSAAPTDQVKKDA